MLCELCGRAAALKGRACRPFAFRRCSGEDTVLLAVLEPPLSIFSFHCHRWCCPVGTSGKPRASQSLEPFKKLSECWHMPFNRGLKWILITPVIERAGKRISANISQGHFSGKNENAQLKIRLAFHLSSCHYKNVAYTGDQRKTKRFVIPHPLQLYFCNTYIIASLHLFLLLGSSVTEVG